MPDNLGRGGFGRPAEPRAGGEQGESAHDAETGAGGFGSERGVASVEPGAEGDYGEPEEDGEEGGVAVFKLGGEHPEQQADGGVEREGHDLFKGLHPGAGAGEDFDGLREHREQQVGRGEAEGDGGEHRERLEPGQRHGGAESGGEERRAARRGNDGREHAGEEGTGEALFGLQAGADAGGA